MGRRIAVASVACAVAVSIVAATGAFACTASAYLDVSPSKGAAGSTVMATGGNWAPGTVEIRWNSDTGTLLAHAAGPSFSARVTIPAAGPGVYLILALVRASDGSVAFRAATPFQVVAAPEMLHVAVTDFAFTPPKVKPARGDIVIWNFDGPSTHTATSLMGLFGSGPAAPGTTYEYQFAAAGKYPYRCDVHPTLMTGTIAVPMRVSPATGAATTAFTVRWASRLPAGHVADIQIKRPGSTSFVKWIRDTTTLSAAFTPDGSGVYSFRARLRNTTTGTRSGFSEPRSISVT